MATVFIIIFALFTLVAFIYVIATERTNKILNAVMVFFGVIIPGGFFGLSMNYVLGYGFPVIWWLDIIVAVVDLLLIAYLIFISGEKLEGVFDNFGNKIGTRGGSGGATLTALAATGFLIGQFAPLCESWLVPLIGMMG